MAVNFHQLFQLFSSIVSRARFQAEVKILFERDSEMIVVIEFKRAVTSSSILSIIIYKLSHWQYFCPIILLLINKCSEVCFYYTILYLGLAIYLGVEDCR